MLKKAYVEITNRCNLACSFCPKTKREPRTMSAQEFGLVLSRLEGYVQYVYLHVMGEPLLHPELTTLFALAKARDMKICITTNGTLLQKRSDELLAAESLHKISVSLHSFEGNDGADEQELSYLTQVWNFAEKAAKKGVIVALRLWNDGGADERNGEILDFLRSRTGDHWPEMRNGSFLLRDHLYLERAGKFAPDLLIYPGFIPELNTVTKENGVLRIGAAVPMNGITAALKDDKAFCAIADAASDVGSPQIRAKGTMAGNLCNASPAGDMLPVSWLYDAQFELMNADGTASVTPVNGFITGPQKTILRPDQAVTAILIVFIIAFLFTTVAANAIAIVGTNPVSGMTLMTLILSSLVLVSVGLSGTTGMTAALVIGGVVCTALSMAGGFITDLKIGYWLGTTPRKQEAWKFLGTFVAAATVAGVMIILNKSYGFVGEGALVAPQANAMAAVIQPLMTGGQTPWMLYFCGAALALVLTSIGVPALAFALGMFIPMELNAPLVVGGLVAWFVSGRSKDEGLNKARFDRGTLIASGFIAGGALMGVVSAVLKFVGVDWFLSGWASSNAAEWTGLAMYLVLIGYFAWHTLRAKKEE